MGDLEHELPERETDLQFWRINTVVANVGLSKSELYRRASNGSFPKPRKYPGSNKTFWVSTEVRRWQRDQLKGGAIK
jgi:predicted DNA-binding transcriptional regulator AlpA